MAKLDLSVVDIRSLIDKYSTDLKLLDFQATAIKGNIKTLEEMLEGGSSLKEKKSGKAGRPPKQKEVLDVPAIAKESKASKAEKTGKKGPGRPRLIPLDQIKVDPNLPPLKKEKKEKAPKAEKPAKAAKVNGEKGKRGRIPGFNRWEEAILEMLRNAKQPLKNEDLMDAMQMVADRDKVQEGKAQLKVRLNQALVKLGNKLDLLNKQPFEGKGFMYSLK
ncbi:MAG: hypothetical protein SFV55_10700 [Haliscomenobacter sp.]|uniref:hypothetical protein n=1 Tax=Haliscomenobacter sp. TaxID=2717303 RepID=UPI0029A00375|nr:hypothetical protein [Haliscomenobacter sp.]MDX2068886.1 hypothetical protein [Haliscomenobacter sp.]